MNENNNHTAKDALDVAQRVGELVGVVAMLLLLAFFIYHQTTDTGFFTSKFGTFEQFLLYGPLLLSFPAPIIRALTGHRNPARPIEAFNSLFLALAAVWYLKGFPFNFEHLADPLPDSIKFVLSWVNNDIGKIPLVLQAIFGPIIAVVLGLQYVVFRLKAATQLPQT
ncbi:MAG: hypothetical protein L0154_25630 [Chloroflexi bacterium]|nr:hypothetical protein [Chloroflexota bacterium]